MSRNQPRGERSESTQYRKTGRSGNFNQQRNFPTGVPAKGGGGGSPSSVTSNPASRGSKKYTNNAQGGQIRARSPNVDSDLGANRAQNGPHQEQPTHRVIDATVSSTSSGIKLIDSQTQKNTQAAVRASSNVPPAAPMSNSQSGAPATPAKGDPAKSFPLQFGSISPGFMNGVQIPARTSSAPPNLDEQKKAQARQESSRAAPSLPMPSIPKQYPPSKKDAGIPDQTSTGQAQPIPKSKRDPQVPATPSVTQTQKPSVHPIPGMPMQMSFHQPQVPVQFGGPNPQIQSQAMPGTSLPLPMQMPLPMGNPPMQQPMFISGLQPHPMQSQGMLHQVQNLNFSTQMAHQLPPQLGSMGINVGPQFPQQQASKYGSLRKSVKITHPETHEELRLDGALGARSHPNVPPQSQPIPSFLPNHPMNFYPNSYSASPIYYPAASSVPMNSSQVTPTSQPLRSYNQVTVKPPVVSHGEKEQLPTSNLNSVGKAESSEPSKLCGEDSSIHQKQVEPSPSRSLPQSKSGLGAASAAVSLGSINMERDVSCTASAPMAEPLPTLISSADSARKEAVPESVIDGNSKSDNMNLQDQDGKQSTSPSSLTSQLSEAEVLKTKSAPSRTNLPSEVAKESPLTIPTTSEVSSLISKVTAEEQQTGDLSVILGSKGVNGSPVEPENVEIGKQEAVISESSQHDKDSLGASMQPVSLKSLDITDKNEQTSGKQTAQKPEEPLGSCPDDVRRTDALLASTPIDVSGDTENSKSVNCPSSLDDKTSSLSVDDDIANRDTTVIKSALLEQDSADVLVPSPHDVILKHKNEDTDRNGGSLATHSLSSIKDKVSSDTSVVKTAAPKTKKKRKELYKKAEAAGTSSDLYMAYKVPEEKKETVPSAESLEKDSNENMNVTSTEMSQETHVSGEKPAEGKVEPDDWEDAVEISPHLGTSRNENQGNEGDGIGLMTKKRYSRDFLLKFADHCMDLPEGFQIASDVKGVFIASCTNLLREHPSPGRNIDRPGGNSRADRRSSVLADDDKWNKMVPGPLMQGRGDMWMDVGYGGNIGFRPNQGGNFGVLRNPRAQAPAQYVGGILSGPMQPLGPQGGLQRNYSDMDRWQLGTGYQRGLMPSPQTPPPAMHRAEKKYEVGKVTDEEQAKQRQLKAILNKLTPQNFEKLFQQVKQVNIDNVVTLSGVISQIFDKALMEPTFCQMYADFCFHLAADLPDLSVDNERITFKRLLLNKCQEEFERGEREEEEANKAEEGEVKQTAEEREEKRLKARRRMLGNIRLIGELYKKTMLTERIMHECIKNLLGQDQNPDEENIEALCKLMSTIGEMIDHRKAKGSMDAYFDIMSQLSNNMKLSSRVRFMLKDSIDLRKNKWQQRRKVEGPKKIEEVHRDAAQERQTHSGRMTRVPSMGNSVRRGPSMDFAPRTPSTLSSPGSHMGSFRAAAPQLRGIGSQDVRVDDRPSSENRTMPLPLPQRHVGDDSITLGPQGGLVRGMSIRGQPSSHLAEMPSPANARTMGSSLNGFGSMPEQTPHGQREDAMPRYMPDRFDAPSSYDRLHSPEQSATYGNREVRVADRGFDRSSSMPPRGGPPTSGQNVSSEKELSEDQLRDKSVAAIEEFYSARDETEVALCVKELNSPSFYPSMISIWITDSFERKDMERDLLTKLLLSLAKPLDGLISKDQLVKGFESVLAVLEDAVNDAPKSPEFFGHIFARVILNDIISLSETGQLMLEGGEEPGSLVEAGLAADIMACVLDVIKSEKGDSTLKEILSHSNLQLESFRPRPSRSSKIDKFIS